MSYDLYLYKKKKDNLTTNYVWETLKSRIQPDVSEVDHQLVYENETTGVYFILDRNEPNDEQDEIEMFDDFENFENLNINLSINFLRPDYFGYETFSIFFSSLLDLDIYYLNLQEFDEKNHKPMKWSEEKILNQWLEHNELVSKQQFHELSLGYYDKGNSDLVWSYTRIKDELEESIKEDIFIPNISYIQEKGSKQVYSFIVWPESIPLIIPQVDLIIVMKKFKRLFKTVEETGITTYEKVLHEFGQYLEKYNHSTCHNLLVLKQVNANKIKGKFNKMKLDKDYESFGIQIGKDGFVNHK